jgi:hypothetical protein
MSEEFAPKRWRTLDGWLSKTTQIICSGERKAIETAAIIAGIKDRRRVLHPWRRMEDWPPA